MIESIEIIGDLKSDENIDNLLASWNKILDDNSY